MNPQTKSELIKGDMMWPECIITGVVPKDRCEASLCADGLAAWGIAMSGLADSIPENFGTAMAEIGRRLRISPLAGNIERHARQKGYLT